MAHTVCLNGNHNHHSTANLRSDRLKRMLAADPPLPAPPAKPLAAERPDAAPKPVHTQLRIAAHLLILVAVVCFVIYYCVWMPVRGVFAASYESATVTSVAYPLTEVRAPQVTGVFHAARPLPNGARVGGGQVLGHIESPELLAQIQQTALELQTLQTRQLQLEEQGRSAAAAAAPGDRWESQHESRDLAAHLLGASQKLAQLESVRQKLTVIAPVDGFLQFGLAGTQTVAPFQSIASLYPQGADLLLEVTAPLDVIYALEREGAVASRFTTAGGAVDVSARPLHSATRAFTKIVPGKPDETWGVLQCVPDNMPEAVRTPGLIGKLH
jgi:multidrug resistance efflux pump